MSLQCGISTHTEIGYRALEYFRHLEDNNTNNIRELLFRHPDALQAGNPFPDFGFNPLCYNGDFHDESEDTHWGEYVKVAFNYINSNYPTPWDEDTERLVAFLFGIISHQVADINWHSLQGLHDGYLDVLTKISFHGSYGAAHDYADVADDMIGVFEWNVTSYATEWYVPVVDLVEIYKIYYGDTSNKLTEEVVNVCAGMLLVGRLAEQAAGKLLYYEYAKQSPVMLEMFRDYYLGGLDDMAAWTSLVWEQAAVALSGGTQDCDIPHNTLELSCNGTDRMEWVSQMMSRNVVNRPPKFPDLPHRPTPDDLEIVPEGRGVRIRLSEEKRKLWMEPKTKETQRMSKQDDKVPALTLTTRQPYSALGTSLLLDDIDGDGTTDLVVGAPGVVGCVYAIQNVEALEGDQHVIEDVADIKFCKEDFSRFGSSLGLADLNKDGLVDLVVGEPYAGYHELSYEGGVTILFGRLEGGSWGLVEGARVKCAETPCGLGTSISSTEGFVLVGAPYAGLGGYQRGAALALDFDMEVGGVYTVPGDLAWLPGSEGSQDYERSASSLLFSNTEDSFLVGSPMTRVCAQEDCGFSVEDVQAAGKIRSIREGAELAGLVGTREFGGLGASVTFANLTVGGSLDEVLVVSEPGADSDDGGRDQSGRIRLYQDGMFLEEIAAISGEFDVSRFGSVVKEAAGGSGLFVGAPYAGLGLANFGKVYYFNSSTDLPKGDISSQCEATSAPCPARWASAELTLHEEGSMFGGAIASSQSDKGEGGLLVAVAADSSSLGARMAGSVYIYYL